ncbi:MAG TPA: carbohydrate ABC transporter permease [Cellulomonas sp.]
MATAGLTIVRGPQTAGRRVANGAGRVILNVVLGIVAIVWLVPTVGLLITSLRPLGDSTSSGWWTVFTNAAGLTLDNYTKLLHTAGITRSLLNTMLIAVPATVLVVVVAALAAYAFAWVDFRGRTTLLVVIIALLAVPLQTAFIPLARLYGAIGIFGSIIGVILFHTAFGLPFAIFLLRNTFAQLPYEMIESARLDGATEWQVFSRFVLPLGMPAVASLAIYQFLWTWNDMLVALIFSNSQSQPITVAIQSQLRAFSSNIDVLASGAFLSMIVPLIIYFVFQKYFESAILAGSTK